MSVPDLIRFGPFELDLEAAELCSNGRSLHLPEQRFRILHMLLFPGLSAGPVDFSPDRKWMAYISYPDGTLWRSRLDGSDKVQLTLPPLRTLDDAPLLMRDRSVQEIYALDLHIQ
jgi:hypothetical protein